MAKPKNMIDLADQLAQDFEDIKSQKITIEEAKSRANTAGKLINAMTTQHEHDRYMGIKKQIAFMDH